MQDSTKMAGDTEQPTRSRSTAAARRVAAWQCVTRPWSLVVIVISLITLAAGQTIWSQRSAGSGAYMGLTDNKQGAATLQISDGREVPKVFRMTDQTKPPLVARISDQTKPPLVARISDARQPDDPALDAGSEPPATVAGKLSNETTDLFHMPGFSSVAAENPAPNLFSPIRLSLQPRASACPAKPPKMAILGNTPYSRVVAQPDLPASEGGVPIDNRQQTELSLRAIDGTPQSGDSPRPLLKIEARPPEEQISRSTDPAEVQPEPVIPAELPGQSDDPIESDVKSIVQFRIKRDVPEDSPPPAFPTSSSPESAMPPVEAAPSLADAFGEDRHDAAVSPGPRIRLKIGGQMPADGHPAAPDSDHPLEQGPSARIVLGRSGENDSVANRTSGDGLQPLAIQNPELLPVEGTQPTAGVIADLRLAERKSHVAPETDATQQQRMAPPQSNVAPVAERDLAVAKADRPGADEVLKQGLAEGFGMIRWRITETQQSTADLATAGQRPAKAAGRPAGGSFRAPAAVAADMGKQFAWRPSGNHVAVPPPFVELDRPAVSPEASKIAAQPESPSTPVDTIAIPASPLPKTEMPSILGDVAALDRPAELAELFHQLETEPATPPRLEWRPVGGHAPDPTDAVRPIVSSRPPFRPVVSHATGPVETNDSQINRLVSPVASAGNDLPRNEMAQAPAYVPTGPQAESAVVVSPPMAIESQPDPFVDEPDLFVEELAAKPIAQVNVDILPTGHAFPDEVRLPTDPTGEVDPSDPNERRPWMPNTVRWEATGMSHQPLYFEQVNLERYGYAPTRSRTGQSILAGAHFFGSFLILPYRIGAEPYHDCVYTLGQYRPGSCVPYQYVRPPLSIKGSALETLTVIGLFYAIP